MLLHHHRNWVLHAAERRWQDRLFLGDRLFHAYYIGEQDPLFFHHVHGQFLPQTLKTGLNLRQFGMVFPVHGADLVEQRAQPGDSLSRVLVIRAVDVSYHVGQRFHLPIALLLAPLGTPVVRNMNPEKAEGLSPELQRALEPLLAAIESLSERIGEYNEGDRAVGAGKLCAGGAAEAGQKGGHADRTDLPIDAGRRAAFSQEPRRGCYLGLQPGRRNSGQSEPQLHISKEGDPYLRTLLVQGADHILGPLEWTAIYGVGD